MLTAEKLHFVSPKIDIFRLALTLNAVSLNRALVSIINQAECISLIKDEFRGIIREELAAALKQIPVQPVPIEPVCDDEAADTIMDFLENFS